MEQSGDKKQFEEIADLTVEERSEQAVNPIELPGQLVEQSGGWKQCWDFGILAVEEKLGQAVEACAGQLVEQFGSLAAEEGFGEALAQCARAGQLVEQLHSGFYG